MVAFSDAEEFRGYQNFVCYLAQTQEVEYLLSRPWGNFPIPVSFQVTIELILT